jgi:tRNA (guanine26-N2/guanine27-N2)-dimethyltransferase
MDPASQEGAPQDNPLGDNSPGEGTIQEGSVRLETGSGFFRPESRPSRDLGVLLAQHLAAQRRHGTPEVTGLRVLDLMAGCGIRSLRYGVEAGAAEVWANDADPDRLALLQANLAGLGGGRCTTRTAQKLLAGCLLREQRFDLIDLDAFGCPSALVPLALEALAFDGVLYLASTDGRSPTGHDRPAAIRSLGAAARAHPASWELALRLQLGVQARAAWVLGRGIEPVFSFSEGRTFRTAVRLRRKPGPQAERQLGLLAHCHGCGDQQVQSLLQLRQWRPCLCPDQANATLSISGPLWIGPLQDPASLEAMASAPGASSASLSPAGARLLAQLRRDDGLPARCWPLAELAKRLGGGPPPLGALLEALRLQGWSAQASGVMAAQLRSDAPWERLLQVAAHVTRPGQTPEAQGGALNR